jgi:hypothetical protein
VGLRVQASGLGFGFEVSGLNDGFGVSHRAEGDRDRA